MDIIKLNFVIPHKTRSVADAGPNPKRCTLLVGLGTASLRSWAGMTG